MNKILLCLAALLPIGSALQAQAPAAPPAASRRARPLWMTINSCTPAASSSRG